MATSDANRSARRGTYPLATEFAIVVLAAVGFYLVSRIVAAISSQFVELLALPGGLLAEGLLHGGTVLAGLALFVGGYAAWRGIDVGLSLPGRGYRRAVAAALAVPAALVVLTALVGETSSASYSSLAKTSYAADVALGPVLAASATGLLVGVPSYLLLCQVLVQGSFERVVDGGPTVALTTLTTGFLLAGSGVGGLSPFPGRGRLVGAVLFGLAIGLVVYVTDRTDDRWIRYLSSLPAVLFVAVVVVSGVAAVESVPGVLFAGTQLTVLGLAALTYERTGSLAVPALAYLSLSLSHDAVVFAVETGVL